MVGYSPRNLVESTLDKCLFLLGIYLKQKRVISYLSLETRDLVKSLLYKAANIQVLKASVKSLLEQWLLLPFRKMRFSVYINQQQANVKLIQSLKQTFGSNVVLVFGNQYATNVKYREPISGKGLDECCGKMEALGYIYWMNSKHHLYALHAILRSWRSGRRSITPVLIKKKNIPRLFVMDFSDKQSYFKNSVKSRLSVVCRCTADNCIKSNYSRLWNRDETAVLNFKHIMMELGATEARPSWHTRGSSRPMVSNRKRKGMFQQQQATKKRK